MFMCFMYAYVYEYVLIRMPACASINEYRVPCVIVYSMDMLLSSGIHIRVGTF